jgi:hypothetical protein
MDITNIKRVAKLECTEDEFMYKIAEMNQFAAAPFAGTDGKYHRLYITFNACGEYYVGKRTGDVNDGYQGSGYKLREMMEEGIEFHTVHVAFFESDKEAFEAEKEAIGGDWFYNDGMMGDDWDGHALNMVEGGGGLGVEVSRKINRKRVEDGTHNFLGGEISRKRVEDGTHNFLGGEFQRENNLKRVEDGTHHFLGGEIQREISRKRVENGTHHFLGGEISRESNRKRVEDGTHNFLGGESNRKRVEDGTHNFLGGENNRKRIENGTHNFLDPKLKTMLSLDGEIIIFRAARVKLLKNASEVTLYESEKGISKTNLEWLMKCRPDVTIVPWEEHQGSWAK